MSSKAEKRRQRIIDFCATLPDVTHRGGQHSKFEVRGRTFAYYLFDHHGDGRVAICVKAPPGDQGQMLESDPARYFSPSYLGPKGWVALRIDTPRIDWREVEGLLVQSYALVAPKSLSRLL